MVRRKKERGFTLIELLIALAISMVGLLGLMALQLIAIRSNASSRSFAEATGLAQEKLEALQIAPVATIVSSGPTTETLTSTSTPASPSQTTYSRATTITANGTQAVFKVDVSWVDGYAATGIAAITHHVVMYDERTL